MSTCMYTCSHLETWEVRCPVLSLSALFPWDKIIEPGTSPLVNIPQASPLYPHGARITESHQLFPWVLGCELSSSYVSSKHPFPPSQHSNPQFLFDTNYVIIYFYAILYICLLQLKAKLGAEEMALWLWALAARQRTWVRLPDPHISSHPSL